MSQYQIGVIQCDELRDDLKDEFKDYNSMFAKLLQQLNPEISCVCHHALSQDLPSIEHCKNYQGLLITGSKSGCYERVSWITHLVQKIPEWYQANIKLAGICFGHQILAKALGGDVQISKKGWGIGSYPVDLDKNSERPEWVTPAASSVRLLVSHQDQVTRLPSTASRLFHSNFCPNYSLYIQDQVFGIQGHPEFTAKYLSQLIQGRRDVIPAQTYQEALESLTAETDHLLCARWLLNFYQIPIL